MDNRAIGGLVVLGVVLYLWSETTADASTDTTGGSDAGGTVTPLAPNPLVLTTPSFQTPPQGQQFDPLFMAASSQYGLPAGLLSAQAQAESNYNPNAQSPAGAQGIMQFMPATAAQFGINPWDPAQAIPAAALYMSQLYSRFGTWADALAAYNWGQGNVASGKTWPNATQIYVAGILSNTGLS